MLFPFFQWCEASWLGQLVRDSLWMFPVIEAIHLLGLCVLGGALLIVDMRLMGLGLRNQPVAVVARNARPWLIVGIVVLLVSGVLLFMSEAVKCYYSPAFRLMIATLPIALAFTFAVRERFASHAAAETTWRSRLVAAVSLVLWFTVAAAGRWIGFSS